MTQDAMPYDNACVEHLVEKFSLPHVKAAYARQLPRDDCRTLERFTRGFNYPDESDIKDAGDLPKLGVKTFSVPMSVQCMTAGHMKSWVDL